jgi:hypothetical protein
MVSAPFIELLKEESIEALYMMEPFDTHAVQE